VRGARRWLILVHRYLGIALSPLFLVWFLSGIAMVYGRGMPELTPATRLSRMPSINVSAIRISASEAARLAGSSDHPARLVLTTVLDRPAYRIGSRPITIFADNGERLDVIDESEAVAIARRFLDSRNTPVRYERLVSDPDQWTLTQRRQLPLHKVLADDSAGTELYISPQLGDVVVQTTRRTRALAWVSAIPHWIYFVSLRVNDRLWRHLILWVAGLATLGALLGLVLAVAQFSVHYQGWLRWHYRAGVAFGVFALTWAFSGFLSMEPWFWARADSDRLTEDVAQALAGGTLDLAQFRQMDSGQWSRVLEDGQAREVEFLRIQGEPHLAVRTLASNVRVVRAGTHAIPRGPFSVDSVIARVKGVGSGHAVTEVRLLNRSDAYYYSHATLPLPVLRLKFDDRDGTWLYVDPLMSRVVARFTTRERVQRWLYNGLHSLDFPFLYQRRPLWDIVVVTLCLGGAFLSFIGVFIAARRVRQGVRNYLTLRQLTRFS
jgi:PepSY-associated TM region